MSFDSFNETLKPCTNLTSSSSSSSSCDPISSYSNPSISHQFDLPISYPRRPPKSSLSEQLLRLQDPELVPLTQSLSQQDQTHVADEDEDEDEDEDDEKQHGFGRPKLDSFQFDHTGPFEPLVLSLPGETPLIQVPASINCRLLEHQRTGVQFLYNLFKNNHGGILGDDMLRLSGFEVGMELAPLVVSHLFYADDLLIFCDVDAEVVALVGVR
ncbi:hypothetical protein CsSME_00019714 [Camellia sinensis var. sinensis]